LYEEALGAKGDSRTVLLGAFRRRVVPDVDEYGLVEVELEERSSVRVCQSVRCGQAEM
jgi:hypothetical protein